MRGFSTKFLFVVDCANSISRCNVLYNCGHLSHEEVVLNQVNYRLDNTFGNMGTKVHIIVFAY